MAKDDMEAITYKVLKYIYESMKAGHKITLDEMAWKCCIIGVLNLKSPKWKNLVVHSN